MSQVSSGRMARTVVLRPATETEWLKEVRKTMHALGWVSMHITDSRFARGDQWIGDEDVKGWPDVFAIRGERVLAAELKSDDPNRKVTPEQMAWLRLMEASGKIETFVWRPMDAEMVLAVLSGRSDATSNLDDVSPGVSRPRNPRHRVRPLL